MKVEIAPEHAWLRKFVGEWTFEADYDMGPSKPRGKHGGTESGRMLGDAWAIVEGGGAMPGGGSHGWLLTLGFDPRTRRFVGSWVGSMMTHHWVYDGAIDADGRTLSLECDGPSFTDRTKLDRYLDAHEFVGDDHRILHASRRGADGQWVEFMTTTYRRVR